METIIQKLQDATDICNLTEHIIAYDEYRKTFKSAALYQFGISPAKESFPATPTGTVHASLRENAILKQAEKYIEDFSREKTHKERKQKIESALNLLITLYKNSKEKLPPKAFILIARAYLLRSIIIRPKGRTVPEKKKEALEKGLFFVDKAIDQLKPKAITPVVSGLSDLLEEAWRIKGQLCLELDTTDVKRYYDGISLVSILKEAMNNNGCKEFHVWKADTKIAIRYCELMNEIKDEDKQRLQAIIAASSKSGNLERAKAYYLLDKKSNGNRIEKHIRNTIEYLKTRPFSDPLWEETVYFIQKLKEDKYELWKKFALDTYEACVIQERKTSAIRLRWYWSRQRDLYDLAFLAALNAEGKTDNEKYREMAEICDSHKSRSSLRWASLEAMAKSSKELEQALKAYESALLEEYIEDFEAVQETVNEIERPPSDSQEIIEMLPGWIVIHFYLNQLDSKGYALIYNADAKKWEMRDFLCRKLFTEFLTWQTNYNLYKEQAANHLVRLCEEIGNAMPFLFDEVVIPKGKDVLFIPHDFLHRLPLHGAIGKDKDGKKIVFLENHPCCYLPAWSFAMKNTEQDAKNHDVLICSNNKADEEPKREHVLLKNFEEDKEYFKSIVPPNMKWDHWKIPASHEDLKGITRELKDITSPELLVILCHGKADVTNPFNARLELAHGGITHLEILKSVKWIENSHIILGACETDLVPPLGDILDEHLSIATAFLSNSAYEILGTMWEVLSENTEKVVKEAKNVHFREGALYKAVNKWQGTMIEKVWRPKGYRPRIFYDIISLRTFVNI